MKFKKAISAIMAVALILLIYVVLVKAINPPRASETRMIYIREHEIDIFKGFFKEPFEILVVFPKGNNPLEFTTHESLRVNITAYDLRHVLHERGLKPEDISFIIHNHLNPTRPTFKDYMFVKQFRTLGFKGASFVYYPHNGRLLCMEFQGL